MYRKWIFSIIVLYDREEPSDASFSVCFLKFKQLTLFMVFMLILLGLTVEPAFSAPTVILTVNDTTDLSDFSPGDGICDTTSTTPGSQCSLRAAIEELNAQGATGSPQRVEFNISGTGPFVIAPGTALPDIIVPVEIDGATQPGASCATASAPADLQIVLDGKYTGSGVSGLYLGIGSDGSTLRGLVIGNFNSAGIKISSTNNIVRCNFVGIDADGLTAIHSSYGILVNKDNNIIGGLNTVAQRNVISNNTYGIYIGGNNNLVGGNYIGTTPGGMGASGNYLIGVYSAGFSNQIGSDITLGRNLISGNNGAGIRLNNTGSNTVMGNYIGVAADGTTPLSNAGNGIEIFGNALSNTIGGTGPGQANHIAYNTLRGISLSSSISGTPSQTTFRGNIIHDNGDLGIDLGNNGVDINDGGDIDGGENGHQNYPVLQLTGGSPVITISLDSQANTQYTIDLYGNVSCNSSGNGEGQNHIYEGPLTTDGSGHAGITFNLSGLAAPGHFITATATDPNGNTSEFSACALLSITASSTPTATHTPTSTNTPATTATPTATLAPSPTSTPTLGALIPPYWIYLPITSR